jgi:hypothetical protein
MVMATAQPPSKRRRMAAHNSTQAEGVAGLPSPSWHTLMEANAGAASCIFEFCTVADVLTLRLVSKHMLECVTAAERSATSLDQTEKIFDRRPRNLTVWGKMFPHWRVLSLAGTNAEDVDLVHLGRVESLDISDCTNITDAAFPYLKRVRHLNMRGLNQESITDAAFAHLKGIVELKVRGFTQLTDAAFEHLRGIQILDMGDCNQDAITDIAFSHLTGIHTLVINFCR